MNGEKTRHNAKSRLPGSKHRKIGARTRKMEAPRKKNEKTAVVITRHLSLYLLGEI
jgi:hypothetical protein